MGVSQEYIDQQRYYADAVQAYKANGMDHTAAWKKAEADWDAGQREFARNADTTGYKPQNADTKTSGNVFPDAVVSEDGSITRTASSGSNSSGYTPAAQSVRYRGATGQSRVGADTRVRAGDTAGGGMGTAMQQAAVGANTTNKVGNLTTGNAVSQAKSTASKLSSVQKNLMDFLNK